MRKAVVAPDSWKGCLSAGQAAAAMARGLHRAGFDRVEEIEMADGGEGTVEALLRCAGGERVTVPVEGPLGEPVNACYARLDAHTAVIETASAAGLTLVPPERRNALRASTYGVGQLMLHALEAGCTRIYVGLGGSATTDGGLGMAQALGIRPADASGNELPRGGSALLSLGELETEGLHPLAAKAEFVAVCDVDNPLLGAQGAAAVFGPQKGASPAMVRLLEEGLERLDRIMRRDMGLSVADRPGAGAAGGLGAGMMAFLGARRMGGAEFVLAAAGAKEKMCGADLVLTGEGRTDAQTLQGKAPLGVARLARSAGVPAVCLSGSLGEGWQALLNEDFAAVLSVSDGPMTLQEAMERGEQLLEDGAFVAGRLFLAGKKDCIPAGGNVS
ncbi:MAG: glycerate kinase [Eubacteriales bacterium]|nr:glycerate kinase [Eubacteriales bacterium]